MKRLRLLIVGAVGAVAGVVLLLLSGVLNFAASSGHWDVTDLFFDLAARQSVTLRSVGIDVPDLDDPRMIRRGAGHYEMVCAACHGSPGRPPEAFAANLTPRPPLLLEQMQRWRPAERTFFTVKHGIKRTAMPAWPTQLRDDEVWEMVAFLEAMPSLTTDDYRALAGDRRIANCTNCHGDDGRGRGNAFPRLDIQSSLYLAGALRAFRDGHRASGTMISAASGLTDAQIVELSAVLGQGTVVEPEGAEHGRAIAAGEVAGLPACDSCHGPSARPDFPRLAGQQRDFLIRQLELFTTLQEQRGGVHAEIMSTAVHRLTPEQKESVADWYGD
ncbi:MAG: c-type cytochrome [Hyphomicrobiales bacterium]|nr:MAG: c-type cytochrome [Hyphomicrobiales bacterium]